MPISARAARIELYEEYLEEASFLYEQRRALYRDQEVTWRKIGEFEERLEAHLDGLVIGEHLALDVCKAHAIECDFGELFAATCVFCRQGKRNLALSILERLDPADADRVSAVADALKYEMPDDWRPDCLTLLTSGDTKLVPVFARAFGYRRLPCGPELLIATKRCTAAALPETVWALGRIAYEPAKGLLLEYLRSEEEPVRSAAAIALARMGEQAIVDYCTDKASSSLWPILPLSLAGGPGTRDRLTELSNSGAEPAIIALGFMGEPASVPFLISLLGQENAARSASLALECITGASLQQTVFVPDDMDDDELFDSEVEQVESGRPLNRGQGTPFGSNVIRISQDIQAWERWWRENQAQFTPGRRYRSGDLLSPVRLVEALTAERTPHHIRQYCCEELAIRYCEDVGIETDMPVRDQIPRLRAASDWSQAGNFDFEEGVWYLGGRRV